MFNLDEIADGFAWAALTVLAVFVISRVHVTPLVSFLWTN
jgi:hypothetical protein